MTIEVHSPKNKSLSVAESERWLNPFWFPSETKVRFGLVILAAGCISLFVARRGLEALGYGLLAWVWLTLIFFLPIVWGLARQSINLLRRQWQPTRIEYTPDLTKTVDRLINDPWLELNSSPQVWITPQNISPLSFGLGQGKHIVLPQFLFDEYHPAEKGISEELEAVLRHELAHIKNGDLRLKGLADIAFPTAFFSLLGTLLLTFGLAWRSETEPVISTWEALYLALALLGVFYLYRTALRWRELYADARVSLGMGTGRSLVQALMAVEVDRYVAHSLGLGLMGTDVLQKIPGSWWPSGSWLGWLEMLFRSHPSLAERKTVLTNPNQLFRTVDRGLLFLSGFLPVLVVGLFFSLFPKESLNAALLTGLSYLWPELARVAAEGQVAIDILRGGIPDLGTRLSATLLVDSLQAAIRLPLALWVLTLVLVGRVARGRGFSALTTSVWFVAGILAAQTTSLEMLSLFLQPQGGSYQSILLGYLQALIGASALAVIIFFYVFTLQGLLRRYPSPPQFRRWWRRASILFIGVVAWESLGAVPLGSTLGMLPYLALPRVVKWLLILVAVIWVGLATRRRCPACQSSSTIKDKEDISSSHRCDRCQYPLYAGWSEAGSGDVAIGQANHWLTNTSTSEVDMVVAGLRRIGRQAGLRLKTWRVIVAGIAPDWAGRLQTRHFLQVQQVGKGWIRTKVREIWAGLLPRQEMVQPAQPSVVAVVIQALTALLLFSCLGLFIIGNARIVIAPDNLYLPSWWDQVFAEPDPTIARLMGASNLLYGFFLLAVLGFLTYLLLRGTWQGRPWAYAVNLVLICLSIIGLPLLLYLLRSETKRHFHIKPDSAVPLAPYLLTVFYAIISLLWIIKAFWPFALLPLLIDPAIYDAWRTLWDPSYISPDSLVSNRWIQAFIFDGFIPLIWIIITFLLARGAKSGRSWAYLVGVGLIGIASFTLLLLPLSILSLYYLLKPEVRTFYLGKRPLVVDLVSSFFLLVSFTSLIWFVALLTSSISGILLPREQIVAQGLLSTLPTFLTQGNWSILALLSSLFYFSLAWGNLHRKRWVYILTLAGLVLQLLTGVILIVINLGDLALFASKWFEPFIWVSVLYFLLSIVAPIPALISMLRPRVGRYFEMASERPLVVDFTTASYLGLGLVVLFLLSFMTIIATAELAIGGFLFEEPFSPLPSDEINFRATLILLFLGLGDFLVIPSFMLAAAVWQGRAWAYRVSLRTTTLAAASFIFTPIALPLMIALRQPTVRRFYLKEGEDSVHPLLDGVIFLHRLNLILWSFLAIGSLTIGIISISLPAQAQNLGLWPSAFTEQDIFWHSLKEELYLAIIFIGAVFLTFITIRGVKQCRSWAYLTSLGLATSLGVIIYELMLKTIHPRIQIERASELISLIPVAIALSLLITMMLRPTRQYFARNGTPPPAAVSWAAFVWLLPLPWILLTPSTFISLIAAQLTYQSGGASLDGATLFNNYVAYVAFVALALFAGVLGLGIARGLWFGRRWAYLSTLAVLALACLAIAPALITVPLLIALGRSGSRAYFAGHGKRPLIIEGVSLAYIGIVGLYLLLVYVLSVSTESQFISTPAGEFVLFGPRTWPAMVVVVVAAVAALGCILLAVTIWQGRPWAYRASLGLGILGPLTLIGVPLAFPAIIAFFHPGVRRFFQPGHNVTQTAADPIPLQPAIQKSRDVSPMLSGSAKPLSNTFQADTITTKRQPMKTYSDTPALSGPEDELGEETRIEPTPEDPSSSIICSKCGTQNQPNVSNCWNCGINLAWALEHLTEPCPVCHTPNPRNASRCQECEVDLAQERNRKQPNDDAGSDGQASRNMFATISLAIGVAALIGAGIVLLFGIALGAFEVSDESPWWGLVFISVCLSGLVSLGGIVSAVIGMVKEKRQATVTGLRHAVIGIILSGLPLICWGCFIMIGLLSL